MVADEQGRGLLERLFGAYQEKLKADLQLADVLSHPVGKGDEAELNWELMLRGHLPKRYQVLAKVTAIDHVGDTSDEIDLLIADRQYSPLVFTAASRQYIPAESVYAVFECKQGLDRTNVLYAAQKVASVRQLRRTSAAIVHAGGRIDKPKEPGPILGGLLTTRVDWTGGLGDPFRRALLDQPKAGRLDLGCAAAAVAWTAQYVDGLPRVEASAQEQAVVYFLLRLLSGLQSIGTAPAMEFDKWSDFLKTETE